MEKEDATIETASAGRQRITAEWFGALMNWFGPMDNDLFKVASLLFFLHIEPLLTPLQVCLLALLCGDSSHSCLKVCCRFPNQLLSHHSR